MERINKKAAGLVNHVPAPSSQDFVDIYNSYDTQKERAGTDSTFSMNAQKTKQEQIAQANNVLQQINEGGILKGSSASLNIYRDVGAISFFNNYAQSAIEQLKNVKAGDNFLGFDMETLGTFNGRGNEALKWYTPTEVAFRHFRVNNAGRIEEVYERGQGRGLSLLIQPHRAAMGEIQDLVNRVSRNKGKLNIGLTADERRTLTDLIMYADKSNIKYEGTGPNRIAYLLGQSPKPHDPVLTSATYVEQIQRGFENLKSATRPETAIQVMNNFMEETTKKYGDYRIAGNNIRRFDLPLMLDYLGGMIGKDSPEDSHVRKLFTRFRRDTEQSLDVLHGLTTVNRSILGVMKNLTLEEASTVFNLDQGDHQAHFAYVDAGRSGRAIDVLLDMFRKTSSNKAPFSFQGVNPLKWDERPVKDGDRFFAISGVSQNEASPFDAVYRLKDNKLTPAYGSPEFRGNPLYRDAEYQVVGQYKDLELGGKKQFGVLLHNLDEDLYHFIARDTKEDIQNIFHQNLSYIDRNEEAFTQMFESNQRDKALRTYNRMFSNEPGGGYRLASRMRDTYEAYEEGVKRGLTGRKLQDHVMERVSHLSPERYRDFLAMRGRLKEEMPHISRFLDEADQAFGADEEAKSIALRHFKRELDMEFGENTVEVEVPWKQRAILQVGFDGEERNISVAKNPELTSRGLSSALGMGHVSTREMSIGVVKERLHGMIDQLVAQKALHDSDRALLEKEIKSLRSGDSPYYILRHMTAKIQDAHKKAVSMDEVFGLSTIKVEDPTNLHSGRAEALLRDQDEKLPSVIARSIDNARTLHTRNRIDGGLNTQMPGSDLVKNIFSAYNKGVQKILDDSGIGSGAKIQRPSSIEDSLSRLVQSFVSSDTDARITYNKRTQGLMLLVAAREDAKRIFSMNTNEILEKEMANVVAINLPRTTEDGLITIPGSRTERVNRLKVTPTSGGALKFTTPIDDVVDRLVSSSGYIRRTLSTRDKPDSALARRRTDIMEASNWAGRQVRETIQRLSLNKTKINTSDLNNILESSQSNFANWVRGGSIDLSGLAQMWYQDHYFGGPKELSNRYKREYERKIRRMEDRGTTFFEELYGAEKTDFDREIEFFARRYGLNVDSHSLKNAAIGQGLRGARSAQELLPFGYFNPMARENFFKVLNYMPLDQRETRENLRAQGYTDDEIERKLNLAITTDRALEVGEGELNFQGVRAAYVDSSDLNRILQESGIDNPYLSTYEGTFLISKRAAAGMDTKRTKVVALSPGAEPIEEIADEFKRQLGLENFDPTMPYTLEKSVNIHDLLKKRKGSGIHRDKLTIGKLVSDGEVTYDYFGERVKDSRIIGWDPDRQGIILEKPQDIVTGSKILTTGGDRITAVVVDDDVLRPFGDGVEAILPSSVDSIKKQEFGQEIARIASLYVDEARQKETIGRMHGREVLAQLTELMQKHFEIRSNEIEIRNNQVVLSSQFGLGADGKPDRTITSQNFRKFMREADELLGTNFASSSVNLGYIGMAPANLEMWQKTIGRMPGREEGVVRYGLKEFDMIQSRIERQTQLSMSERGKDLRGVTSWLDQYKSEAIEAQNRDPQAFVRNLDNALLDAVDPEVQAGRFRPGEVVLRSDGFSQDEISRGQYVKNIEEMGGTYHISQSALSDLPSRSAVGQDLTVKDYVNTILRLDSAEIPGFEDFNKVLKQNQGSVLFELPDETFSQRYVRFIDTSMMGIGEMPIIKEIQKAQLSIWRSSMEYKRMGPDADPERLFNKVEESLANYRELLAHTATSSRDGSLMKNQMSVRFDMSGQFIGQGVNPFYSGSKALEEATVYVSKEGMSQMIDGAESRILRTLDPEKFTELRNQYNRSYKGSEKKPRFNEFLREETLAQIEKKGLYGIGGRFPTIAEDTVQPLKITIDPTLQDTDQFVAKFTVGTSKKMNLDYDGDFANLILSHYGEENYGRVRQLHQDFEFLWRKNKEETERFVRDEFMPQLQEDAKAAGKTMAEIWDDKAYRENFMNEWSARASDIDALESNRARTGIQYVGIVDNQRQKLLNIATSTYRGLEAGGMLTVGTMEKRKAIEEFGRVISQDSISSKKFNTAEIRKSILQANPEASQLEIEQGVRAELNRQTTALQDLISGINRPDYDGQDQIRRANEVLDLFEPEKLDSSLEALDELWRLNQGTGWLNNTSVRLGISEGVSPEEYTEFLQGGDKYIVDTPWVREFAEQNKRFAPIYEREVESYQNLVQRNYLAQNEMRASDTLASSSYRLSEEVLSGASVAETSGIRFRDVFSRVSGGGIGGGAIAGGAAIFGGLWGASALVRSEPTPEQVVDPADLGGGPPIGSAMGMLNQGPTARVTQNPENESINISISAKDPKNINPNEIAVRVQNEINAMMSMDVSMNMNINDNTQNIDQQWLQGVVANALNKGFAY